MGTQLPNGQTPRDDETYAAPVGAPRRRTSREIDCAPDSTEQRRTVPPRRSGARRVSDSEILTRPARD